MSQAMKMCLAMLVRLPLYFVLVCLVLGVASISPIVNDAQLIDLIKASAVLFGFIFLIVGWVFLSSLVGWGAQGNGFTLWLPAFCLGFGVIGALMFSLVILFSVHGFDEKALIISEIVEARMVMVVLAGVMASVSLLFAAIAWFEARSNQ